MVQSWNIDMVLGFRVCLARGLEFRIKALGHRVSGIGSRVEGPEIRVVSTSTTWSTIKVSGFACLWDCLQRLWSATADPALKERVLH